MKEISNDRKRFLLEKAESLVRDHQQSLRWTEWKYVLKGLNRQGLKTDLRNLAKTVEESSSLRWLTRSDQTESYFEANQEVFQSIQGLRLSDEELRFLVGWIDRTLKTLEA